MRRICLFCAAYFAACIYGMSSDVHTGADLLKAAEEQTGLAVVSHAGGVSNLPPVMVCEGPFTDDFSGSGWAGYRLPAWIQDAKFGVFLHWGPASVEGHYGWPFSAMYQQGRNSKTVEKYGHPSEFGYKDLIPLWTAKDWDPDAMTAFFKKVGFKYVVPVARHHDNFDMWDSTYQPWNAKRMGAKRDVIGEFKKAADKYGLRFGVSDHPEQTGVFKACRGADKEGAKAGVKYDGWMTRADGVGKWWEGEDPQRLYPSVDWPTVEWVHEWYLRTQELIDRYGPDYFYFDGGIPFGETGKKLVAHYFNSGLKRHEGSNEVVLSLKRIAPQENIVLGYEIGKSDKILPYHWQSDTTMVGPWFHSPGGILYTPERLIWNLVDIVSKNGSMLLNVALTPEGIIPDDQRACLEGAGEWLAQNGEAVYGTRPWKIFGEGPTVVKDGPGGSAWQSFTARDIRYTLKDGKLYAIVLGIPEGGEINILTLSSPLGGVGLLGSGVVSVELLGSEENLIWEQGIGNHCGLKIKLPAKLPNNIAPVFRVSCKDPVM